MSTASPGNRGCLRLHPFNALALVALLFASNARADWPAWNGPKGYGRSPDTDVPKKWNATNNVRWKVPLPDRGNSTPIVWGDRVFVTQAHEKEKQLGVICFSRTAGRQLWESKIAYADNGPTHPTNPYGSASPVTDGKRVVAAFGSAGVYCYNLEGKELWHRDLGKQTHEWGYGASPVIEDGLCYVHFGPGPRTFLTALDVDSGKTAWTVDLPFTSTPNRNDNFNGRTNGYDGSWSTPLIVEANGRKELILTVPDQVRGYDPRTGKLLWYCEGLNPLVYTSPIYGEGVIVAMGGFLGSTLAVRPGGTGNVTGTHRLWHQPRAKKNRIGSGVIHRGHIYLVNMDGIAECMSLATGETVWLERVRGPGAKAESWSSVVQAGDWIYAINQSSDSFVFKANPQFELAATNPLDGAMSNSTIAISRGELFIRTHTHLWCISDRQTEANRGTGGNGGF